MKTFEKGLIYSYAAEELEKVLPNHDEWESVEWSETRHLVRKGPIYVEYSIFGCWKITIRFNDCHWLNVSTGVYPQDSFLFMLSNVEKDLLRMNLEVVEGLKIIYELSEKNKEEKEEKEEFE